MTKYLPRAVSLMALAHLTIELCNNFMPVVYPVLITAMGLTYTQVGLVVLVSAVGSSLLQPVFGYLSDRWGASRMTVVSVAWIGVVMGLVGFAWSYPSLMLLVGLGALGSSAFHPAGATIASTPGSKRRGAAMSIFSVSGNIGTHRFQMRRHFRRLRNNRHVGITQCITGRLNLCINIAQKNA